jgi:hypothetical protein
MLDYSWTFIFKYYCVGALNGWQTIWEEMISDHGNQFIRKLRKVTPSICYGLRHANAAAGLYFKAVSGVNQDLENVMAATWVRIASIYVCRQNRPPLPLHLNGVAL